MSADSVRDSASIGQQAGNKEEAIRQVAAALVSAGNVADGYVNGMLAREQQTSTFLGNGIAIPHGTTDTRDQVLKTGVQVFQFPQGVTWGEGQTAYATKPAPAARRTSRTSMVKPVGAPVSLALSLKLYWVLAIQTGRSP